MVHTRRGIYQQIEVKEPTKKQPVVAAATSQHHQTNWWKSKPPRATGEEDSSLGPALKKSSRTSPWNSSRISQHCRTRETERAKGKEIGIRIRKGKGNPQEEHSQSQRPPNHRKEKGKTKHKKTPQALRKQSPLDPNLPDNPPPLGRTAPWMSE